MSQERKPYSGFLGTWSLDPASCVYEQGSAPQEGIYHIEDQEGVLHFLIDWVDVDGKQQRVSFSGVPDGEKTPFSGAPLADAMSVDAPSDSELVSAAYWQSERCMVATRTLSSSGKVMHVVQMVRLPDGTELRNQSTYFKNALA